MINSHMYPQHYVLKPSSVWATQSSLSDDITDNNYGVLYNG